MIMEKGTQEYLCPNCAINERMIGYVAEQEIAKGTIKEGTPAASRVDQHLVAPPGKPPTSNQSAPLVICSYDYCTKCGQEYCFRITWDMATFRHQSGLVVPKLNAPPSAS